MEIPDTGSAFEDGHRPRGAFFFAPHPPCSPLVVGVSALLCGMGEGADEAGVFEEADDTEDIEDEELVR